MLRRLLLARSRASLMAASKPSGERALISLTLATLMLAFLLPACATKPFTTRAKSQTKGPSSERMSASEMIPTSLSPSATTRAIMSRSVTIATGLSIHYRQRSLLLLDHQPSCIHYARSGLDCDHAGDH